MKKYILNTVKDINNDFPELNITDEKAQIITDNIYNDDEFTSEMFDLINRYLDRYNKIVK